MVEPSERIDGLARAVIGAAIEVHRELGPGFLEGVYEEALAVELALRGIACVRQQAVEVWYKGHLVGEGRIDLLVDDGLVVEVKAVETLLPVHRAQVVSYLRATGRPLGLLLNFRAAQMRDGIERVIWTR